MSRAWIFRSIKGAAGHNQPAENCHAWMTSLGADGDQARNRPPPQKLPAGAGARGGVTAFLRWSAVSSHRHSCADFRCRPSALRDRAPASSDPVIPSFLWAGGAAKPGPPLWHSVGWRPRTCAGSFRRCTASPAASPDPLLRGALKKSPPTWSAPLKRSTGLVTEWMMSWPRVAHSPVESACARRLRSRRPFRP